MQFLEENKGINLCDLGLWNDFLSMTKIAQVRKEKITDKLNLKAFVNQRTPPRK